MDKMNVELSIFVLFALGINYANSLDLSPSAIAKTLHKGAYEAVKGTVNTVTEVVGTPVDIKDVHFFLHTSKDHGYPNHTVDPLNPAELATRNGKVYFLIHGWTQNRQKTPWYRPLTEYLLKKHPEAHVVQLDWGKAADNIYALAAFGTESVGNIIGDVIKKLVVDYNVPRKNIVVIGHSLGGQISGWVGKRFRKLTNSTLPRIIALDPAGPLFLSRPEEKRLNKHDAEVVMVLHSDGGKLGFGSSCGTIDIFPNGGSDQPGCFRVDLDDVSTLAEPIWCDHQRGYNLFLEAVKSPCLFLAKKCESYDKFKENKCENIAVSLGDLEASSAGSYYFNTTAEAPFIRIEEVKKHERYLQHSKNGINEGCLQLLRSNEQDNHGEIQKSESHERNRETLRDSNTRQDDEDRGHTYEEKQYSRSSNSENGRIHQNDHRYSSDGSSNKFDHKHSRGEENNSSNDRQHQGNNRKSHQDRIYEENGSITPVSYQEFKKISKKSYQESTGYR
ncbi:phospholipase A1-like [Harmonia axyridis]|uniref:phospholipase A1-like n=1 Tax=Harmonia axyridis TaxID=115357 RepID=UPI001E2775AA|nr:phospholipase A1-like [Harmonia axyridis]